MGVLPESSELFSVLDEVSKSRVGTSVDQMPEGLHNFLSAPPATIDDASSVDLVSRTVAFVDLLGTSAMMKKASADRRAAQEAYDKVNQIKDEFAECVKWLKEKAKDVASMVISDSYVISVPPDECSRGHLVRAVARFQRYCLLKYQELSRGGVAKGLMVKSRTADIIGEAFIRAHVIEESVATYPRVVVSPDAYCESMDCLLSKDKDGELYVSFLAGISEAELKKASQILTDKVNSAKIRSYDDACRILQKIQWTQTYVTQVQNKRCVCCQ